ncbi:MAG: F0F1 ATP synthase subunit B [Blastochloris sp.]|nr:F0F1 ATP synthase subunit B [Blastochloris sp.]
MNNFLFLAAAAPKTESDSMVMEMVHKFEGVGVNASSLLAQFIVFLTLAFLLKKFAFDPILAVMDERRRKIAESLENAEKIKKELVEAEATRREIISKANAEATALIEEAKKSADLVGSKRIAEATAQAESVLLRADEAARRDREKLMSDLKKEVAGMVVRTTAKVVGRVITAEDEARLRQEAAGSLS